MALSNKEALKRSSIDRAGRAYATLLRKTRDYSKEQFDAFQEKSLYTTYRNAVSHVPYYQNTSQYPRDVAPETFMTDFSRLPILEKTTVKQDTAAFIRQPRSRFLMQLTTSGTTGSPLVIYQTPVGRVRSNALVQSVYEIFCGLKSPRIMHLSASLMQDQISVRWPGTRHAALSIYHLNKTNRDQILKLLQGFKPELIHGFPSALSQLARLFPDGLPYEIPGRTVRCVATSETLFPETRRVIEERLGVIVHNEYGSQEGQHFAFECEHRSLHIHPARGYVEILDFETDRPAAPGEAGRIVVTGFQNRHMPLVRYSIGDTASKSGDGHHCDCGITWPVLHELHGRTQDLIKTPDGNRIGLMEAVTLRMVPGISESQIIQTDFDAFTYVIVSTQDYDAPQAEAEINKNLTQRLGYPVNVNFEYVGQIEKTAAGKHRAVIVNF